MSPIPPEDPKSRRTVLDLLSDKGSKVSRLLLPDSGSEHGASPILDPKSTAAKLVPQGRNKYQIIGEIARGGMGVILKGHDSDLGRDVALKVLDPELAKNPAVVSRFVEEAQIGGQLQHPGIVPVYELGLMADDAPYFTMKLVKGRTLSALLSQRKSPGEGRTRLLTIFESVCQTMAYAHSKSVLHRDLKPANIMVGAFGEVQVVDWGLAKVMHRGGVEDEKRAKQAQQSIFTIIETVRSGPGSSGSDSVMGSVMGTPAYMSPEQAQGELEKLDERADVFSLGAILCEILTGRPPYEGTDAEPTLVHAARAKLDPARGRIDGCDADPALKKLCLECMLPARDARPRDADAVARTVHDYLSSVEDRAHKAELAATTASIKAAEERRARRLTLALAGTVVAAVLLGGGGYLYVKQEREQRAAQARSAVEASFSESNKFAQENRLPEALEAARRAQALAAAGDADAAVRDRAAAVVTQAEQAVNAAQRERSLLEQDTRLRDRLIELRLAQIATIGSKEREQELHTRFVQAFTDYGVDLDGDRMKAALDRIRERRIAGEVALALDDLGRLRRDLFGEQAEQFLKISYLAMDLDPEPERVRLRKAILDNDLSIMLQLAAPENLPKLPPGSIWILSATLWDRYPQYHPEVYRMYDEAIYLYPNDYVLQSVGANIYRIAGRFGAAVSCRMAAFSLQPNTPQAGVDLAEELLYSGRLLDSLGVYRACAARFPSHGPSHYGLGACLLQLGDNRGAVASFQKALAINDDPQWRADLLATKYMIGQAGKDDLAQAIAGAVVPEQVLSYCNALIEHPEAARRDPAAALKALGDTLMSGVHAKAGSLLEAMAKTRLGDWAGANEALAQYVPNGDFLVLTPLAQEFLRAVIYAHTDRLDAARECHRRGLAGFAELMGSDPAAWERSDVIRWRHAAEQALGL